MGLGESGRVHVGQGGSRRVPEGLVGSRRVWTDMTDLHWSGRVQVGIRELGRAQEDLGGSCRFHVNNFNKTLTNLTFALIFRSN